MPDRPPEVIFDRERGYRRLDPIPSDDELELFYRRDYLSAHANRAPDVRRLMADLDVDSPERKWRFQTLYPDVVHYMRRAGTDSGRVLDVGCGTGEFLYYLARIDSSSAWKPTGLDLSDDSIAVARTRGLDVIQASIGGLDPNDIEPFAAVTMFNVLEHLPDPSGELRLAHRLLQPGGVIVVSVPNDFSILQEAVRSYMGVPPWWVAIPDHINYFERETLASCFERAGFEVLSMFATFPMEFFLIAGLEYISDAEAGAESHRRRCEFEMSLDGDLRRELGEQFAQAGIGRSLVMIARKPASSPP